MDLFRIIQNLRDEKKRIEKAISALEELATGQPAEPFEGTVPPSLKKRRGRPPKPRATLPGA